MGRWIAIGKVPGWDDITKFSAELSETSRWRPDPQTTITTVFALGDGRVVAECHATKQADFEAWLNQRGWQVETLTPIKHVAKTGSIWKVS
jgi:hypothetical protein